MWDEQSRPDRCDLQSASSDSVEFSTPPDSREIRADLTWLKGRSDGLFPGRVISTGDQPGRFCQSWVLHFLALVGMDKLQNGTLTFHSFSRVADTVPRHIFLTSLMSTGRGALPISTYLILMQSFKAGTRASPRNRGPKRLRNSSQSGRLQELLCQLKQYLIQD